MNAREVIARAAEAFVWPRCGKKLDAGECDKLAAYALRRLKASGLAIVPVEPTEAMLVEGRQALLDWDARTGDDHGMGDIWSAMLTAAQKGEGE